MNPKQRLFVTEYLKTQNGAQAAVAAGYAVKAARQIASRLLTHADIRDAIATVSEKRLAKAEIDAQWLLDQLVAIANTEERTIPRLRALELIGRHIAIGAFHESRAGNKVLVVIRDYSGRAPTHVDAQVIA